MGKTTMIMLLIGSCLIGYRAGWMIGLGIFICSFAVVWNVKENLIYIAKWLHTNK